MSTLWPIGNVYKTSLTNSGLKWKKKQSWEERCQSVQRKNTKTTTLNLPGFYCNISNNVLVFTKGSVRGHVRGFAVGLGRGHGGTAFRCHWPVWWWTFVLDRLGPLSWTRDDHDTVGLTTALWWTDDQQSRSGAASASLCCLETHKRSRSMHTKRWSGSSVFHTVFYL